MRIRFLKDVEVKALTDICCFSGSCSYKKMSFKAGEELVVSFVCYGPKIKTKARPGQPGGRLQKCSVHLQNQNASATHPDYFVVEASCFEEIG